MKYLLILLPILLCLSCKKEHQELKPGFDVSANPQVNINGIMQRSIRISVDGRYADSNVSADLELAPFGRFSNGDSIQTLIIRNGVANVMITASQEGTTYLNVSIKGQTKTIPLTFSIAATAIDTLTIDTVTGNVPADDYSYAHIRVRANDTNLLKTMKTITFKTDKGKFANGDMTYTTNISLDGSANAYLKHNVAERAIVTATVGSTYTKELSVNFTPALPHHVFIDLTQSTIDRLPGATAPLSARLTRDKGKPSEGQTVFFSDSTAAGNSAGIFLQTTASGKDGIATTTYSLQDTTYKGYIYLIGKIATGNGDTVRGTNRILVQ